MTETEQTSVMTEEKIGNPRSRKHWLKWLIGILVASGIIGVVFERWLDRTWRENIPPQAIIDPSSSSGEVPLQILFDGGNSNDPDGGRLENYDWTIDGDHKSAKDHFTHVFQEPGKYRVKLTVVDRDGEPDIATHIIIVTSKRKVPGPKETVKPEDNDILQIEPSVEIYIKPDEDFEREQQILEEADLMNFNFWFNTFVDPKIKSVHRAYAMYKARNTDFMKRYHKIELLKARNALNSEWTSGIVKWEFKEHLNTRISSCRMEVELAFSHTSY